MDDPFGLSRSLFMITDSDATHEELQQHAIAGVRGVVSHVLVRRPGLSASELYQAAIGFSMLRQEVASSFRLIIHDRIDVALGADADGAHIPQAGLPAGVAKRLLGEARMLGASVHNIEQAVSAARQGCDYLMFGHVYETQSHPGEPGRGIDALRDVCVSVSVPVIAVGGITPGRVDDLLAAGASGVAVIRAISGASNPELAARDLRRALDTADYPHLQRKEP